MRDIPGHEGRYAINEDGTKILSYSKPKKMYQGGIGWTKERYLIPSYRKYNYLSVTLSIFDKNGKHKPSNQLVHRLVAITYLDKPDIDKIEINHKDKNPSNNHYLNLEWVTREENIKHSWSLGRTMPKWKIGRIHLPRNFDINQIIKIRNLFKKGYSQSEVSKLLNINRSALQNIFEKRGCYSKSNNELKQLMTK